MSSTRDLNYDKYFVDGSAHPAELHEFNSDNTRRLNADEVAEILRQQPYVRAALAEWETRP